jgi:Carbohydrate esterase 2 N-terminal
VICSMSRPLGQSIRVCLLLAGAACVHVPALAAKGVEFIGRWASPLNAPVASWAGSGVRLHFSNSSFVAADLTVARTVSKSPPDGKLYISISVDAGERRRIGLDRGFHPGFVLASGLSAGVHTVDLRDENEPYFGSLQFAHPTLAVAGRWNKIAGHRPIVEVIGDSDATGICALGPLSPAAPANLFTSAWASQTASWPALLATKSAALGHPIEIVDLAISGSTTGGEAAKYDQAAPYFSDQRFSGYSGHRPISLALLWGGINDHNHGGDLATGVPLSPANLSPFQSGVYDQITKIFRRSPRARIGLLDYVDPVFGAPDWKPAYMQVVSLFPESKRKQLLFLAVNDPPGSSNACDIDPKGHPSAAMHEAWATQIFSWMVAENLVP